MPCSILPRTTILINERLPKDLANIVIAYFRAEKRTWENIMIAGEYETCIRIPDSLKDKCMFHACKNNYLGIAELMYSYKERDWKSPYSTVGVHTWFRIACEAGHAEIVNLMIAYGANNWDGGLSSACLGGHMEIVRLMISHGGNFWSCGLADACRGGHIEIAKLMISKGAGHWCWAIQSAQRYDREEMAKFIVSLDSETHCYKCRKLARDHQV